MRLNQYFNKSLSRQFVALIGVFILFFMIGTAIIYLTQQHLNNLYFEERADLVKKEKLIVEINETFHQVLFDARGYFAYGNEQLKKNALAKHPEIRSLNKELEKVVETDADKVFLKEMREFTDYYFIETFPQAIRFFETGKNQQVIDIANGGATERINKFQNNVKVYLESINKQLDEKVSELAKKQSLVQVGFIIFIVFILLTFFFIVRVMLKNVGQPLAQFALAANEIAKGREAQIQVDSNRADELGALSIAFTEMIKSVQEKEQNLLAQNEELIAQQDELQAQQVELEAVLETIRENEQKLERRNKLTNTISNSLNKQEVLDSIVLNMSYIIEADKGLIAMLNDDRYSAFGVSENGVNQFRTNINNGLNNRLITQKKPFSIKREIDKAEKGFHESLGYCYDLYLPIISSNHEVVAVLVFSRLWGPFLEKNMGEYEALAKQVGMSLDKINMFEQTEDARKLNQDILNTIQEGIQLVDKNGSILQVNEQLCDMFACDKDTDGLVGLSWEKWTSLMSEVIVEKDLFLSFVKKATEINDSLEDVTFTYKKTNNHQVVKVYCEALFHDTDRVGTVIVHRDITREFEVDQMKSEFVSTVSHELRTPLSSILGFTELLINRQLKPERQQKYLSTIYNETKRLTALINDFLDVQRMEAGKQTYEKKYIELLPIINKVIENQRVNTNIHTFSVNFFTDKDFILGDKSKVEQLFTNMINNAIKYSPDGGDINVTLFVEDGFLKVDIQDEGLGIPEDTLDKIFSKFYRIDNTDRRQIGGTGLGLAIVQEIMKAHEGEISVSSEFGKGSTFTLSFPVVEGKKEETNTEKSEQSSGYKIMVVEDDKSLGELISHELSDSGFKVRHFLKGKDAIINLKNEIPDAIVLDIMLEDEVDGWNIMKYIKSDEQLKNIPIIVSTALDEKEKGFSLGAIDYLVKPYKPSQLSKAIMQTLLNIGKIGQILIPQDIDQESELENRRENKDI